MKKIASMLLVMLLILSCACAEGAAKVRPSVTIADVVLPENVEVSGVGIVISLNEVQPETKEQVVLNEIIEVVKERPITEYFGTEVIAAVETFIPETAEVKNLVMDEIFVLNVEGYDDAYGNVEAVFEFVTSYREDTVLVAMVGILPYEGAEDDEIVWIPMQANVVDGKVKVAFTQEVLEVVQSGSNRVVFSLLRVEDAA